MVLHPHWKNTRKDDKTPRKKYKRNRKVRNNLQEVTKELNANLATTQPLNPKGRIDKSQ